MPALAISLQGAGVAFPLRRSLAARRHWALRDVDLGIEHGDKLGVLGGNGAGKSTLLRVLSGALIPDRGVVRRDHGKVQLLALNLGFIAHLSGRENAILSGLLQGVDRKSMLRKLDAIRDFAGLDDFFDEPISTYSSGMVSRLGFAVAMQLEPDILLIDETLSVGDAEFRSKSSAAIRERFAGDHTVVLVSHSDATIRELCTKAVWLEHGRVVAAGPVAEVMESYSGRGVPDDSFPAVEGQ